MDLKEPRMNEAGRRGADFSTTQKVPVSTGLFGIASLLAR